MRAAPWHMALTFLETTVFTSFFALLPRPPVEQQNIRFSSALVLFGCVQLRQVPETICSKHSCEVPHVRPLVLFSPAFVLFAEGVRGTRSFDWSLQQQREWLKRTRLVQDLAPVQ